MDQWKWIYSLINWINCKWDWNCEFYFIKETQLLFEKLIISWRVFPIGTINHLKQMIFLVPPTFNHKSINSGQFNHLCIWPVWCLAFAPLFPIVDLMNQSAHRTEERTERNRTTDENGKRMRIIKSRGCCRSIHSFCSVHLIPIRPMLLDCWWNTADIHLIN